MPSQNAWRTSWLAARIEAGMPLLLPAEPSPKKKPRMRASSGSSTTGPVVLKAGRSACINRSPTLSSDGVTGEPSGLSSEWSAVTSTTPVCVSTRTMGLPAACLMTRSALVHPASLHTSTSSSSHDSLRPSCVGRHPPSCPSRSNVVISVVPPRRTTTGV